MRHINGSIVSLAFIFLYFSPINPVYAENEINEYLDLELEDLLSLEVTSVSRKRQSLNEAPAAIYVISQEDIQRSGVTSIPEALRMAPGLHVARIDGNKWAISSRGFSNQFANKLLVLIDGRSVYTSSYSGVYWEIQDTLLEDIDRIEVIRGPGATLWGANAVNGVINIITKHSKDTQGGLLVAGAGNQEKAFAGFRYGSELKPGTYGRFYLKYNDRDSNHAPLLSQDANDDWQAARAGFRLDGAAGKSSNWTLQGDAYETDENELVTLNIQGGPLAGDIKASGWNILARWEQSFNNGNIATMQLYYDYAQREELLIGQQHGTFDLDTQLQFKPFSRHEAVIGFNYRHIDDEFDNTPDVSLNPAERKTDLFSFFLQDDITLLEDKLTLTLGSKFEHNDYSGFEYQPSARLLWHPAQKHTLWGSVSRAIRSPSRIEHDAAIVFAVLPAPINLPVNGSGVDSVESEDLLAYELGYRWSPRENISLDAAVFYNKYDDVVSVRSASTVTIPFVGTFPNSFEFANDNSAEAYGIELIMNWFPYEWWRLTGQYSFIRLEDDSNDEFVNIDLDGSSPQQQYSIRSLMDISSNITFDMWAYFVDELPNSSRANNHPIPDYFSFNARLAWRPVEALELSLTGQNLLQDRHTEFAGEIQALTEIKRSYYGQLRWDF